MFFKDLYAKRNENYVSKDMLESWSRYDTSHFAQVDINKGKHNPTSRDHRDIDIQQRVRTSIYRRQRETLL
jgi:hypothetical protein